VPIATVTIAEPAATAVTIPLSSTVTTFSLLEDQLTPNSFQFAGA